MSGLLAGSLRPGTGCSHHWGHWWTGTGLEEAELLPHGSLVLTACVYPGFCNTFHLSERLPVRETQSEDGLGLGGRGPVGGACPREAPVLLHADTPRTCTGMGQKRYRQEDR